MFIRSGIVAKPCPYVVGEYYSVTVGMGKRVDAYFIAPDLSAHGNSFLFGLKPPQELFKALVGKSKIFSNGHFHDCFISRREKEISKKEGILENVDVDEFLIRLLSLQGRRDFIIQKELNKNEISVESEKAEFGERMMKGVDDFWVNVEKNRLSHDKHVSGLRNELSLLEDGKNKIKQTYGDQFLVLIESGSLTESNVEQVISDLQSSKSKIQHDIELINCDIETKKNEINAETLGFEDYLRHIIFEDLKQIIGDLKSEHESRLKLATELDDIKIKLSELPNQI